MRELKRICGERFILPTSYTISSQSLTIDAVPIDAGGFGDIYKGELDGLTVCAKRVKVYSTDGSQKGKKVRCPVVPFHTITDQTHRLCTKKPLCGDIWITKTSSPSSVLPLFPFNSFQSGCPMET